MERGDTGREPVGLNSINTKEEDLSMIYVGIDVAISHACKKLVRLIYRLQLSGETYRAS